MAISVGSVEVDVIPNTQGIYQRLRGALVPAATRAGEDAGTAAGRSFGPAMQGQIGDIGLRIGQQIGQQIASRITAEIRSALRDGVTQGGAAARVSATRQGDETGGAFSRAMKARLEAAFRALPKITIDADTSQADADLQALRVRMETLAGKRIGIDIDAEAAKAEIKLIEAELTRLGAEHPNVQVRADTATALAQLAQVRAAIAAVDGKRININTDVDAGAALAALFQLGIAIGGLALIPAIPVLAAGLGSIAAAGVAAAVGVGAVAAVAIPAFKGIASTLQAQKAAQDAATNATAQGGHASGQGAAQALQLAGAQQALATAHRNAARQITQAEQAVGDAVRSSTEANIQAAQQVKAAKQALADAVQQAADRQQQAADAVERAEDSLATAQRTARQAQLDLTQARKDAVQELSDLANQLADAQLSERDAVLDVQDARVALAKVQAKGATASVNEQLRAQLGLDQALQRLKEQKQSTKQLAGEKAAADKAGVEGSATVQSAQQRLADAEQAVADQQKGLVKARADASKQQIQNQQNIASAQEKVAEASRNVSKVQEDGARSVQRAQESLVAAQQSAADSISSAQRQIASASQSAAGGVDQAAVAQAKYQAELAKLTPAARGTLNAFVGLKSAFSDWSKSLQPQVMPIFTRALNGLKNALPGLTPFVLGAVRAITTLQDRVSAGFKSPWWKTFKADLAGSVEPAIVGLGVSFGRIFKGMAGIIQAFLPHMDSISATMQRITGRFSDWGSNLKGSTEFEGFLAYASRMGPVLAKALGDISSAFYQVSKALSPLSGPVLQILGSLARGIASIAKNLPWLIQGIYLVIIATKLWTLAMFAFNLVMDANPIVLIIIGIVALVAAVIYAYKNFGWFRTAVQAAWSGIQTAVSFAWNSILKPAFDGIWAGLKVIGGWAMWLWRTVLSPVFSFIGAAARLLATIVLTILIAPFVLAFQLLAAVGQWLWNNVLGPIFGWIGNKAMWLWNNAIKPAFTAAVAEFKLLAAIGQWLWKTILSPVFQWIGDKAKWLWNNGIKPWFAALKTDLKAIGTAAKWVWDKVLSPVFGWIGDKGKWLWDKALKPAFDQVKKGVKAVGDSFNDAKGFISKAWSAVQDIAKKPVRFIIDKIYNGGIVPTWNKIASAFGAPQIKAMQTKGWATGGVLPGYTPGKDVHKFYSPTGGGLELSGGEAIMRPEFTRAVGGGFINSLNKIASTRGSTGVKAALAPTLGGNPLPSQQFAGGGIFGWIGKAAAGVGSTVWDGVKKGASWLKDGLEASARAGVKHVVDPLLAKFPGASTGFGKMIRKIPTKALDSIFGYSKEADKKGAGGIGGPKIQTALKWAKTQNGLPYQWAGNGSPSWDCSGLMSAIESVIRGQKPHRRWATGSFSGKQAPSGWVQNAKSPFMIGITNAGVGHTAGTLGGVNVESRGGDGVVVGKRARAWNNNLFTSHYGFQPGKFDDGGYLPEGLSTVFNGTGSPEPVFTTAQANALTSGAAAPMSLEGQQMQLVLDDGTTFNAHVEMLADGRVQHSNGQLVQTLRAGRRM